MDYYVDNARCLRTVSCSAMSESSADSAAAEAEESILIRRESDIARARQLGRRLAQRIGLSEIDQTYVATSISELATNLFFYATRGTITVKMIVLAQSKGLEIISKDEGPGIADTALALRDGYSTNGGLGSGLGGVRRMMDEFKIQSQLHSGTTITVKMWAKS